MVEEIKHYYDVYSKKHQTYANKKFISIENLLTEIQIIEDCIGFTILFSFLDSVPWGGAPKEILKGIKALLDWKR